MAWTILARWGDALLEAGFEPNKWNGRGDSDNVLLGLIAACRHYGRVPTGSELEVLRRAEASIPHPSVIKRHFGRRSDIIAALAQCAAADATLSDIAAMLPDQPDAALQPRPPSKSIEGFVYLIRSGDFYKIGRSDELERRVKEIRVALPDKAELVHSIRTDDPSGIEAYWHRRFTDRRANGEWFKLTSIDISAFRKRKFQ